MKKWFGVEHFPEFNNQKNLAEFRFSSSRISAFQKEPSCEENPILIVNSIKHPPTIQQDLPSLKLT